MEYGFQKFRIQNVFCERVRACAQFLYRGYEVSMSQIFDTPSKVAVFAKNGKGGMVHECDTVQEAITWIIRHG